MGPALETNAPGVLRGRSKVRVEATPQRAGFGGRGAGPSRPADRPRPVRPRYVT
jgi:hypothetical protein